MRTLIVLAKDAGLGAAIQASLDEERFRVLTVGVLSQVSSWFLRGGVDGFILDAELNDVEPIRVIAQVRRLAPECPLFVFAGSSKTEWEEEAYLEGVTHIFSKPVRGPLLNTILDRFLPLPKVRIPSANPIPSPPPTANPPPPGRSAGALGALRDLSALLTHSLHTDSMLREFLLLMREVLGVNRAAIFVRRTCPDTGTTPAPEQPRLRLGSAMGLAPGLLDHFELSIESGIGRQLCRSGRILTLESPEALQDEEIQNEFELLGVKVAIPVLDRETLVGVAVFDGRLTGEWFTHEELALIFHLLEELGLALRNSWLHDQLAASHRVMADILDHLNSACLLFGRELAVLHANRAAQQLFAPPEGPERTVEFANLPRELGGRVFAAQQNGLASEPFKLSVPDDPHRSWRVTVTPFPAAAGSREHSVLVLIEDWSLHEQSQRLEIEAANLRLVRRMAEQLAHAIGNSLVPIVTYHQLSEAEAVDPHPWTSIRQSAGVGIRRITRLSRQMLFLARDLAPEGDPIDLEQLVEEAMQDARKQWGNDAAQMVLQGGPEIVRVVGDRAALRHALCEVFINGLESNPQEPLLRVGWWKTPGPEPDGSVTIEVSDTGTGFTPEIARRGPEPFFSTRNTGLGLGLTVTRAILHAHGGRLEILPSVPGEAGRVRLHLRQTPRSTPSRPMNPLKSFHEDPIP